MFNRFIKYIITTPVIIYSVRCTLALIIGHILLQKLPDYQMMWTLISIILVISPEGQNSKKLSIERFKSNLVGSIAGLVCLEIEPSPDFWMCLFGFFLTIITCFIFNILNMARVALVALIIILIQPQPSQEASKIVEATPLIRALSVTLGCFIGLAITVSTSIIIRALKKKHNIPLNKTLT
ncbi:FUSC family protein [Myroides sp. LJL116]